MSENRMTDRFGGILVGIPAVALPVWIASWSQWLAVVAMMLFLFVAVSYVFGFAPKWFERTIVRLVGTKASGH